MSLLSGACVPKDIAMTGEVRALIQNKARSDSDFCLDHTSRARDARRWNSNESPRCAPCTDPQGDLTVGEPERCGTRRGSGSPSGNAIFLCQDYRRGS